MAATCVDLVERFGDRYRVGYEQSYLAEHGDRGRADDAWLRIILCQHGHIMPWGGETLAAVTAKAGPVARRLAALRGVTLWQDGSDGATVLFPVTMFEAVAEVMLPRRRRRLSPENRRAAGERLARFRFPPAVGIAGEARDSTQGGRADLEHRRATTARLAAARDA